MIYIEDIISKIYRSPNRVFNLWDNKIIDSFYYQILDGFSLTEKQAALAVKILKKHNKIISKIFMQDVTNDLESPNFKLGIRKIVSLKKIEIIKDNVYGKVARAIFPYNENIIKKIRDNKEKFGFAMWDKEAKCWNFPLNENFIKFLSELSNEMFFDTDDEFKQLEQQIKNIINDMEKYALILAYKDNHFKIINSPYINLDLKNATLLEAIFEARKYGITTWDSTIEDMIQNSNIDHITKLFLKTDPKEKISINNQYAEISCLSNIVKYLSPCLMIIPGGDELQILSNTHKFLSEQNFKNEEISVMFRLPSDSYKQFNEFVKDNHLNSPVNEKTKIVFISGKLPKPMIKSNIKFNSIINFGLYNPHYSMRDYITHHENCVIFSNGRTHKDNAIVQVM